MQSLVDRLRSIGSELTDQDLVLYTLQGLGSEYENFIIAFSMCHTNSSIVNLHSLVLAHEARLQVSLPLINSPSAHIATSTQSNNYNSTLRPFLLLLSLPNNFLLPPIIKGLKYNIIFIILDLTGVKKVQEVEDVADTTLIPLKLLNKFISSGATLLLLAIIDLT
jgi:gag-polypeptide of LTR copia-type